MRMYFSLIKGEEVEERDASGGRSVSGGGRIKGFGGERSVSMEFEEGKLMKVEKEGTRVKIGDGGGAPVEMEEAVPMEEEE